MKKKEIVKKKEEDQIFGPLRQTRGAGVAKILNSITKTSSL